MNILTDRKEKESLYWMLHLTGWTLYAIFKIFINQYLAGPEFWKLLANFGPWCVVMVTATHLYKRYFLVKWVSLPFRKLIIRLLAGALLIMVLLLVLTFIVSLVIYLIISITGTQPSQIGLNSLDHEWQKGLLFLWIFADYCVVLLWSVLYVTFNYFGKLERARIKEVIKESNLKDMQLRQLIRQLNPHFLFNSINSIKALTLIEPEKAREGLTRLSDILRHTLSSEKSPQIPLSKELMIVEDYLSLEKIRFGKRLQYTISCTEEAAQWQVPPVIIQTLAENAIKHGISQLEQGGWVTVEAAADSEYAFIKIQNTGSINKERLFSGIGTKNTISRLDLLYGQKANFNAINSGGNAIVTLKIPRMV